MEWRDVGSGWKLVFKGHNLQHFLAGTEPSQEPHNSSAYIARAVAMFLEPCKVTCFCFWRQLKGTGTFLSATNQQNRTKSVYQVVCRGVPELLRHLNFKQGGLLELEDSGQSKRARVIYSTIIHPPRCALESRNPPKWDDISWWILWTSPKISQNCPTLREDNQGTVEVGPQDSDKAVDLEQL